MIAWPQSLLAGLATARRYLKHGKDKIERAALQFPTGYSSIITILSGLADSRAKEAFRQLLRAGISILGVVLDRGEHFVMWK